MAKISLIDLPEELICLIATHASAYTALSLIQTCHKARVACYNAATFRDILARSQFHVWDSDSLHMDTIALLARNDASIWLRYAVADHRLRIVFENRPQDDEAGLFVPNEPELLLLNHPSLYQRHRKIMIEKTESLSQIESFCLALSILAKEDPIALLEKDLLSQVRRAQWRHPDASDTYLWVLCLSILTIRNHLHRRHAAWPYNNAATLPYISLPSPTQLLESIHADSIPLPFHKYDADASMTGGWSVDGAFEVLNSYDDIVGTNWCGYYTGWHTLDPPMMNIIFERLAEKQDHEGNRLQVNASDCVDGVGPFQLSGSICRSELGLTFRGRKSYQDHAFDWRIKWLTPRWAAGTWGVEQDGTFIISGLLCLWRAS